MYLACQPDPYWGTNKVGGSPIGATFSPDTLSLPPPAESGVDLAAGMGWDVAWRDLAWLGHTHAQLLAPHRRGDRPQSEKSKRQIMRNVPGAFGKQTWLGAIGINSKSPLNRATTVSIMNPARPFRLPLARASPTTKSVSPRVAPRSPRASPHHHRPEQSLPGSQPPMDGVECRPLDVCIPRSCMDSPFSRITLCKPSFNLSEYIS